MDSVTPEGTEGRQAKTLSRQELTAALAARQLLMSRERIDPARAITRLTPLQGQHPPAPYLSLAARLEGFERRQLEAAIAQRKVVKTTLMRRTLHLVSAEDHPAYARLQREAWLRTWRNRYPHLDEAHVVRELRRWFRIPRSNEEIRARVRAYDGVAENPWEPVAFARAVLPLVQLPPAGFWNDSRRARFVVGAGRLPTAAAAAERVLRRYLAAFGPASRRDLAAWAGVAQRDFEAALRRVRTISYRDERGTELLDLPGAPLPPASTTLPVRLLAHWDQPLLAYADRERIIPPELHGLGLTLSGAPTVTVGGRVAASWELERSGETARITVTPHVELSRCARSEIAAEAKRTARIAEPEAVSVEVALA
jgi:hypothetical protein